MASVVPGNSRELPLRSQKNNQAANELLKNNLPLLSEIMKNKAEKKLQKIVQKVS